MFFITGKQQKNIKRNRVTNNGTSKKNEFVK